MKKITFAILGMGNRGTQYALKQLKYPEEMEVTAISDTRKIRLEAANKYLRLPADRVFDSAEKLLEMPKLADIMIVATQDAQHKSHAIAAMQKGYDLLLEKPISNRQSDCIDILNEAEKLGRKVFICHVLRYTVFYQQIKRLISEGVIGDVETVEAAELVGAHHYAHSYVRGNWHREEKSSPMILAKSCHDMDIISWIIGKRCEKLNSFGSLNHFKSENCPKEAADRCFKCPVKCPFNANKYYLSRIPGWPSNILHPEPTPENITEILRTSDYGRCVYKMDNDVVDHQTVNMLFEGDITATFQMSGFTNRQTRTLRVMGSKGEIWGDFREKELYYQRFGEDVVKVDLESLCDDFHGHGGGDARLIYDVIRYMRGDVFDTSSMTTIDRSIDSHIMAFAAENSRKNGGELINLYEYKKEAGL